MVQNDDWDEVQQVLNAEIEFDDPEAQHLYDEVARYAQRADVLEDHGSDDDAKYFKELAVAAYNSFVSVAQMKKSAEDYRLDVYEED